MTQAGNVILSAAKDLASGRQILRCAQDDMDAAGLKSQMKKVAEYREREKHPAWRVTHPEGCAQECGADA